VCALKLIKYSTKYVHKGSQRAEAISASVRVMDSGGGGVRQLNELGESGKGQIGVIQR